MFKRLKSNPRVIIQYPYMALLSLSVSYIVEYFHTNDISLFSIEHFLTFILGFFASFIVIKKSQMDDDLYIYSIFHLPSRKVNTRNIETIFTSHLAKFGTIITFVEVNKKRVSISVFSFSIGDLIEYIEDYCVVKVKHMD